MIDEVLVNKGHVGNRVHVQVLIVCQDEDDVRAVGPQSWRVQDILAVLLSRGSDKRDHQRNNSKERIGVEDLHIVTSGRTDLRDEVSLARRGLSQLKRALE